jgi:tetratricopeptide (TPR) repeat protein
MIREDYVLTWIKRFVRLQAEIAGLVKTDRYQEACAKIDRALEDLADRLGKSSRSARVDATLALFYEQAGQFAKAEDALFSLIEAAPGNTDALAMGAAFYGRLLRLDDGQLAAGGLPREEVEAGLAELKRLLNP